MVTVVQKSGGRLEDGALPGKWKENIEVMGKESKKRKQNKT